VTEQEFHLIWISILLVLRRERLATESGTNGDADGDLKSFSEYFALINMYQSIK
jgi:hypothetical protein